MSRRAEAAERRKARAATVAAAADLLASGGTRADAARILDVTDRHIRRSLSQPDSPLARAVRAAHSKREGHEYLTAKRQWERGNRVGPEPVPPRDRRLGPDARPELAPEPQPATPGTQGTVILGQDEALAAEEDERILAFVLSSPPATHEERLDANDAARGVVSKNARRRFTGRGRRTPQIQVIGVGGSWYDISGSDEQLGWTTDPFPASAYGPALD